MSALVASINQLQTELDACKLQLERAVAHNDELQAANNAYKVACVVIQTNCIAEVERMRDLGKQMVTEVEGKARAFFELCAGSAKRISDIGAKAIEDATAHAPPTESSSDTGESEGVARIAIVNADTTSRAA